jgi:hypothetical protein
MSMKRGFKVSKGRAKSFSISRPSEIDLDEVEQVMFQVSGWHWELFKYILDV